MADLDTFGEMFISQRLEIGVQTILTERLDMYLAAVERELEVDAGYFPSMAETAISTSSDEDDSKPGDYIPYIAIVAPGMSDDVVPLGDGRYVAKWSIGISACVKSFDKMNARLVASSYAAAIRSCILQNKSLGGVADKTQFMRETFDSTPVNTSRTIGIALMRFEATVIGVADALTVPNRENEPVPSPEHDTAPDDYETVEDGKATLTIDTY